MKEILQVLAVLLVMGWIGTSIYVKFLIENAADRVIEECLGNE